MKVSIPKAHIPILSWNRLLKSRFVDHHMAHSIRPFWPAANDGLTPRAYRLLRVVCPASPNARQYAVHVFSEEWFSVGTVGEETPTTSNGGAPVEGGSRAFILRSPRPPSFLVEFVGREPGVAALNWLEISRSRASLLQQLKIDYAGNDNDSVTSSLPADWECPHRCPEINACISSSLWCDGRSNCPSGYDEDESHCGAGRKLFAFLPGGVYTALGVGAATAAALTIFLCVAAVHRIRTQKRRRRLGKKKRSGGGAEAGPRRVPTEEMLLDPSGSTTSS